MILLVMLLNVDSLMFIIFVMTFIYAAIFLDWLLTFSRRLYELIIYFVIMF